MTPERITELRKHPYIGMGSKYIIIELLDEIEKLQADNERYRTALEKIADNWCSGDKEIRMQHIAAEALKDG